MATTKTLKRRLEHDSITQLEAPNKYHEAFTWRKLQGDLFCTKARSMKEGWGITKHLDRIVDLGILSQIPKSSGI
jgi:hypothetical protein